jgi:hypothetical protein
VTPNRAGDFTIPAIDGTGASTIARRQRRWRPDAAPNPQEGRSFPAPSFRSLRNPHVDKNQSAFLHRVPEGETCRRTCAGEGKHISGRAASANSLPTLSSDAFHFQPDDNPEQTRELIDGVPLNRHLDVCARGKGSTPLNLDLP